MKNIAETLKGIFGKISEKTKLDKGILIAVILLFGGVVFLIASEIVPGEKTVSVEPETSVSEYHIKKIM